MAKIETIVILAGGKGTRLMPLTADRPKALVEVCGRPFLSYQLLQAASAGFSRAIVLAGHLGDQIQSYCARNSFGSLDVQVILDGPKLLGTGGCIKRIISYLDETYGVLYGDSYLPINLREVCAAFNADNSDGLMTLYENSNEFDVSNATIEGTRSVYNKQQPDPRWQHIDYGFSIFKRSVFERHSKSVFDLSEVQSMLSNKERLQAFEVSQRFYEIGSFSGLNDFQHYVFSHHNKLGFI